MKSGCVILLIVSMLLVFPGWTQTGWTAEKELEKSATAAKTAVDEGSYQIGKGDVLEINVWKEPILSGDATVRTDGMISIVLLGDIQAAGRTPMALKANIQEGLKKYLEDPVVTVILKSPASQRFYIIGEVKSPGEYDLVKDLTVVQALARAGGFSEWADKDSIHIIRKEGGAEKRIPVNYKDIVKGRNAQDNVLLQANDTIVVP